MINLEELATPTRQVERQTILTKELPVWIKPEIGVNSWSVNRVREGIQNEQNIARQEQKVCDKRFALGALAEMIKNFKESVEGQAEAIR